MKAIKKIALLLIAVFVITPVVLAQAGTVEKNVSMIVDGQLNSTDWFDAEDSTFGKSVLKKIMCIKTLTLQCDKKLSLQIASGVGLDTGNGKIRRNIPFSLTISCELLCVKKIVHF